MNLIEQLLHTPDRLAGCWLGNDGWLFAHGGHLIATDLDFFLDERTLPRFDELPELAKHLDVLLVTHAHTDHFNPATVKLLMEHGPCKLILSRSCEPAAREYGLDPGRILFAEPGLAPLDPQNNPLPVPRMGGVIPGLPGWLRVEAIRAIHGHVGGSVYAGANRGDCGYIIHFGAKTIVQPGDSVLLQEHLSLCGVDLLLISPTEHNMGTEQSRFLIETIRPEQTFAQHFGTYREDKDNAFWTHGYQERLLQSLSPEMRECYSIPVYQKIYSL